MLQPYLKSHQIFQCPSDTTLQSLARGGPGDRYTGNYTDYCYNVNFGGNGLALSVINYPAVTIMNGETDPDNGNHTSDYSYCNGTLPNGTYAPSVAARTRHLEGANYAFVDGHVKWLRYEKLTVNDPATGSSPTWQYN